VIDHYDIHFTHDWPTVHQPRIDALSADCVGNCVLAPAWEQALPAVREKYRRRIERFRKVCREQEKVFFFRSGSNRAQAIILRDFFREAYPSLNFILIIPTEDANDQQAWQIEGIRNFYATSWHAPAEWARKLKGIDPAFADVKVIKHSFGGGVACQHCLLEHMTK